MADVSELESDDSTKLLPIAAPGVRRCIMLGDVYLARPGRRSMSAMVLAKPHLADRWPSQEAER